MAAKPSTTPRWAETAGGTPAGNITTPSSGQQDTGWTANQSPPSGYFNWFMQLVYDWVKYLADAVFVATAGSGLPGVSATGDTSQPGAALTAGGGASPARGALALTVQTAPSAPTNGDVWTTATAFFARIAGSTFTLALLEAVQTFTGTVAFAPSSATAPGLTATAGGGGSPARGAIAMTVQTAPSAPVNGDLWATTVAFFARIAGATKQILTTDVGAFLVLCFGGTVGNTVGSYFLFAGGGSTGSAALSANSATNGTSILAPSALVIRGLVGQGAQGTNGTVTIALAVNGVLQTNIEFIYTGISSSGYFAATVTTPVSVAAGQLISVVVQLSGGSTSGTGATSVSLLCTMA